MTDARSSALDVFRAVVCVQIVAMHMFVGRVAEVVRCEFGDVPGWVVFQFRFGYESFFVLAGYFLAHSFRPGRPASLSLAAFFKRRLVRLAVPFWIAVGFGVGWFELSALASGQPRHPETRNLLPLLLFVHDLVPAGQPSPVYWFLAPLMQFYLMWGLGFWLVRRWQLVRRPAGDHHDIALRRMVVVTGLVLLASLGCVAADLHPRWRVADNAVYLALGCFAYWRRAAGLPLGWLFAVGVAGLVFAGLMSGDARPVAGGLTAVLLPRLATAGPLPNWIAVRAVAAVGRWSYSIYLTHTFIGYRVLNVPAAFGWTPSVVGMVGVWLVAVLAGVGLGAAFYFTVERPLARAAGRIHYRR